MIFLTITGSFTGALIYDRREKRRAQQKWCDLVAHLSKETLPIDQTRRKLTVYLAAPPGDGMRTAREYFQEYVKPFIVASALDYNVVEGKQEGDVRAALAERIRKSRRGAGEPSSVVDEQTLDDVVANARSQIGVSNEPGPQGDLIIGRHTWKEYIRGLHEGWLGPLDPPPPPPPAPSRETTDTTDVPKPDPSDDASPTAAPTETKESDEKKEDEKEKDQEKKEGDEKPPKPTGPTPAYLAPTDYPTRTLPATFPQSLPGSIPVHFPNLLGFLNTPIRIYRYLNQRYLADDVGREVAAIVLSSATRPYQENYDSASPGGSDADADADASPISPSSDNSPAPTNYEQQHVLEQEEVDWHKSVRAKREDPNYRGEWLDGVVVDPRVASRMQRYILSPEDESRSERIGEGKEYILGEERPRHVPFWERMWIKYGYGEDEEAAKKKPIIANLDGEDGE